MFNLGLTVTGNYFPMRVLFPAFFVRATGPTFVPTHPSNPAYEG